MYDDDINEDHHYNINDSIMNVSISHEQLDKALDILIDQDEDYSNKALEIVMTYALQHFYRNNKTEANTTEVHEKVNMLIAERAIHHMDGLGILDSFLNEDGEVEYKINDKGREYFNESDI